MLLNLDLALTDDDSDNYKPPNFSFVNELEKANCYKASDLVKQIMFSGEQSQFDKICNTLLLSLLYWIVSGQAKVNSEQLSKLYFWTSLVEAVLQSISKIKFSNLIQPYNIVDDIKNDDKKKINGTYSKSDIFQRTILLIQKSCFRCPLTNRKLNDGIKQILSELNFKIVEKLAKVIKHF